MAIFERDNLHFNYYDDGTGLPFVFQHGLGGDFHQPLEHFQPQTGIRLVSFDCRGHGETRPLGSIDKLTFADFADDLLALVDHLGLPSIVVGGISMGAGLALNFTIRYPQRVRGLILSRPAWLEARNPPNLQAMVRIGRLIQAYGAQRGRTVFQESEEYQRLLREAPDVAESLSRQFEHPRAEETVAKLECMPGDAPIYDRSVLAAINVPTLILASQADPVHAFAYGEVLAREIEGATLKEITAKSISKQRHIEETQHYITDFLKAVEATD